MTRDLPNPRHFPPPPPLPKRSRPFQRVPPAIFPAILGLLGLGLGWRVGAQAFGVPGELVEVYLGAVSLLFLFAAAAYAAKVALRPGVVLEDLRPLPGRNGLATLAMSTMLFAAVLVPYAPGAGGAVLVAGFLLLALVAGLVLMALVRHRSELGPLSPALQLVFAGFITAPIAAIPMGWKVFIPYLIWYASVVSLLICLRTIPPFFTGREPAPLRPLHAIHLAPAALVSAAALAIGETMMGLIMLGWASVLAALLVLRARWLTAAGFSGFWSAFTFPAAAFAGAWLMAWSVMGWEGARIAGGVVLVAATLLILPIAVRILRLWADGTLAAKTNAAIA